MAVAVLLAGLSNFFFIPNLIILFLVLIGKFKAEDVAIIQLFLLYGTLQYWFLSFLTLFKMHPGVIGKTRDGQIPLWSWIVFFPYHLYVQGYQNCKITSPSSRIGTEVIERLYISGWKYSGSNDHHPKGGFHRVLDLTCELPRRSQSKHYLCIPTWDGAPCSVEQLEEGVQFLTSSTADENLLVHCANGRGRSALFILAYLLRTKKFNDVDVAFNYLKGKRSSVKLLLSMRIVLDLWLIKYNSPVNKKAQ